MVFVPIKYIYPTRMEYLSRSATLRKCMLAATVIWGAATLNLLSLYPGSSEFSVNVSIAYIGIYFLLSLYRTFFPLEFHPEVEEETADTEEEALARV